MTARLAPQATAFTLALIATLAMLGGVNSLAMRSSADSLLVQASSVPVQHVVIVAPRAARA